MNPERWESIGEVFEEVVVLPTEHRAAVLDQACGADADLHAEVASLLASHRAAGGFLQDRMKRAVAAFAEATEVAHPTRVGPYRLVRELGRGGMGTVFLAERDDEQYQVQVAVKLVRPGMDTAFILDRFRRERQTLARLQHPNICRLLDGHTTDSGLPYIVMEYIDGRWLTDYARDQGLGVAARLRLFLDVCAAVDYAHRNFIVHRDLKPSNILVDRGGVPKLLDFGICKLLTLDAVTVVDTVAAPMTPNYASPEQVNGEPVTLLSDVYSLGAVLYELLVGVAPRRFEQLTPSALARTIERPIPMPSAAAGDAATARLLKGDLDNILMRALDSEPERRYESAAQLADDLRRYLDHEPVRARPSTVGYRAAKLLRRHRQMVSVTLVVFVALTIALTFSIYQARLAATRLQQVRSLASKLVFDVHDAVRDLPGATNARQIIVKTGLEYLDAARASVRGDARAEIELARAYRQLGDVQGDVGTANLGDPQGALTLYRNALPLLDDALRVDGKDHQAEAERLLVYSRIGTVQSATGQLHDAIQTFAQGIALAGTSPSSDADVRDAQAALYLGSSDAKRNMSDYHGALADAAESLRLGREALAARPSDPRLARAVATEYAAVGMAQSGLDQLEDARANFEHGAEEIETLVSADPRNVSLNRDLMLAYGHVADVLGNPALQNLGDRAGALRMYQQAAAIGKRLFDADRADARAITDYGIVLSRVETAMGNEDLPAKIAVQRESRQVLEQAARISPQDVTVQIYRALVDQHLGDALSAAGDRRSALSAYLESAALAEPGLGLGNASSLILFVQSTRNVAVVSVGLGRRSEALTAARRALDVAQHPPAGASSLRVVPRGLSAVGLTYAALFNSPLREPDDRQQALLWLRKSLNAWHASQSEPGFGAPHRLEMRAVEDALARVEQTR